MGAMRPTNKSKSIARSVSLGLIAIATMSFTVGCGASSPESSSSPGAQTVTPPQSVDPTANPNEIDKDAEAAYRKAISTSQAAAASNGLTELWYDSDGELVQVSVQDQDGELFITQDMMDESVYEVDESAMMPAMLLAELDALAVSGSDFGYVVYNDQQQIEVSNNIDDIVYVTTYEIGQDGLIYKATINAEGEPLGEITYAYSVTSEGQSAIAAFQETN
jgi:hypothetical protein